MSEAEVRRIIREVCDQLDRRARNMVFSTVIGAGLLLALPLMTGCGDITRMVVPRWDQTPGPAGADFGSPLDSSAPPPDIAVPPDATVLWPDQAGRPDIADQATPLPDLRPPCGVYKPVEPTVAGVKLMVGKPYTITWTKGNGGPVNLYIDRYHPAGILEKLVSSTPDDGSQTWTVTGPATGHAVFRVECAANKTKFNSSHTSFFVQ